MITRRDFVMAAGAAASLAPFAILTSKALANNTMELRAQKSRHRLAGNKFEPSDLWLYNGEAPGPEIRVTQRARVKVHFINELDEPTSIHWHGIRIENAMDGVSGLTQDPVPPGGTFDYDFVVPDAGTFWYHAHNKSWEQVARGLYGPLIVEEPTPSFDRDHDITLMMDDWRLGNDGSLQLANLGAFMDWSHAGRLGNWLTVNGVSQPEFKLNAGENYRLRLINAANARVLQISPKAIGAKVIGYDGFVFDQPREHGSDYLAIAPAQRVDLLIRGDDDGVKKLTDIGDFALQELSGQEGVSIAKFSFVQLASPKPVTDVVLHPNRTTPPDALNAKRVPLLMAGGAMGRLGKVIYKGEELSRDDLQRTKQVWTFNGVANLAEEPLFRVKQGETVIVQSENQTGWLHGMHVHGHHFQVISRNGQAVTEKVWRDTYIIDRDEKIDIAFVAGNPGKWLLHCHMLEHAAAGMQTWFEVV